MIALKGSTYNFYNISNIFKPFVLYDIESKECFDNNSYYNDQQINLVTELVFSLMKFYNSYFNFVNINSGDNYNNTINNKTNIGLLMLCDKLAIISPYSTQVLKIKIALRRILKYTDICPIEVNTVDGFQGKEKDIIIFSTVRSKGSTSIGFLKDEKRMNVGLSRAKTSLIVIGDSKKLIQDSNWEKLVKYSYKEAVFYKVNNNCNIKNFINDFNDNLNDNTKNIKISNDNDFIEAVYKSNL